MYQITNAASAPYSAICYIVSTWPNGTVTRASGVIIGPNDVLTALHVVYNARAGGWASALAVTPGADTYPVSSPFGVVTDWPQVVGRTGNWDSDGDGLLVDQEAQYDMAVLGTSSRIGDSTGWLQPIAWPADFEGGLMLGYPAGWTGLMAETVFADASSSYGVYDVSDGLGPGASGGPLLVTRDGQTFVAGVLSSGAGYDRESSYAALFGAGSWDWLQAAVSANDVLLGQSQQTAFVGAAGDDILQGNALANSFMAGDGNDQLTGAGGDDRLDGEAGLDSAVFLGARSGYQVVIGAGSVRVADQTPGREGTDTLTGVERLKFSDQALALDLDGHAGAAARILGAVYGADAVTARPDYLGFGLARLDGGMGVAELMRVALDARLGPQASDAAVVNLLYTNLFGAAPSPEQADSYEALLGSGLFSQTTLALYAADSALNGLQVGLTGLAATGVGYLPQA